MVFDSDDPRVRGDEVASNESLPSCYNDERHVGIESKNGYQPSVAWATSL
jgi:hypothetical protein